MSANQSPPSSLSSWQMRIFWLLWGAYASYYLCRVNFAVAQPLILKEFPDWTNAQIGSIPSTYALFYAVGTGVGGIAGPLLFGLAIERGTIGAVAAGYYLGAILMIAAGVVEIVLGVEAARRPLEQVAPPLSVVNPEP